MSSRIFPSSFHVLFHTIFYWKSTTKKKKNKRLVNALSDELTFLSLVVYRKEFTFPSLESNVSFSLKNIILNLIFRFFLYFII